MKTEHSTWGTVVTGMFWSIASVCVCALGGWKGSELKLGNDPTLEEEEDKAEKTHWGTLGEN